MKLSATKGGRTADEDFLQPDVPAYGDEREYPQPRDADEELLEREADEEDEEAGAAPEEHIG
jgi:hypothetical protein